jgi:hypothetical protein
MEQNTDLALPPRVLEAEAHALELAAVRQQARAQRDAAVRGVTSVAAMRAAIQQATSRLPLISSVARYRNLDAAEFRALAAQGQPFLLTEPVTRWPLSQMDAGVLRQQYAGMPVRARVGDYINTAFALDRAMQDMTMGAYLDLIEAGDYSLPPYLGNLELRELNRPMPLAQLLRQNGAAALLDRTGRHHHAAACRLRRQHLRPDLGQQAHHAGAAPSRTLSIREAGQ